MDLKFIETNLTFEYFISNLFKFLAHVFCNLGRIVRPSVLDSSNHQNNNVGMVVQISNSA